MNHFLLLLVMFLGLACAPALAQRTARADAEARALLGRIDAARGSAHLPDTLVIAGTYQVFMAGAPDGKAIASGDFREAFAGADRARHESDMGAFGKLQRGVTAELAWEVEPSLGAKRYDGVAGATVRRFFALLRGAAPDALYAEVAVAGRETIDGRPHVVLRAKPTAGADDTWYVDAETSLPARIDLALPSPDSAAATFDMDEFIDCKLWLADWKTVGGVAYAHTRRLEMGPATVASKIAKVEPDAEIDAATLQPPEAAAKLKPKAKSRPVPSQDAATCEVVDRQPQPVASIRVRCKSSEISKTLAVLLPEVMGQITATGGKIAGPPFSRYHGFTDQEVDLEAGMPVAKAITEKGRVKNGELPGGKVATAWHIGPYEQLSGAHTVLAKWVAERGLKAGSGPWEVYWTDPGMVPDPQKWRTQLFLPIE